MFTPQDMLGPTAALVVALIAVGVLWREDRRVYKERMADFRSQRDIAAAGWQAQTEANVRLVAENAELAKTNAANAAALQDLARAWAAKTRSDSARRRMGDRR